MTNRLFLFDGTAIVYRAYFAIDVSLTNSRGEPTNAVYGTARMLSRFIKNYIEEGDYALFAFDRKEATHRHDLFEGYKATRAEMPEALVAQLKYIPGLVEGFGIKFHSVATLEADDIIATVVTKYRDKFDEIVIVSGDKDILQLVDEKVKVLRFVSGLTDLEEYDRRKVEEKFGVPPEKIYELLSLCGDTSDNIPGVPGIGIKTALKLLKEYGSIDEIYKNIRKLSPGLRKKLMDGKTALEMSKKLVRLVTDADLHIELEELRYRGLDKEKLRKLFLKLEFASLLREFDLTNSGSENNEDNGYRPVSSQQELDNLFETLKKSDVISIDLETSSLDPHEAKIVGISVAIKDGEGFYIPVNHESSDWQADEKQVLQRLKELLEDSGTKIVGQNLKFDYEILEKHGIEPVVPHFDTMIAAYLLNPDSRRFNLDDLALKFLGYRTTSFSELMNKNQLKDQFEKVSVEEAAKYSVEDADIALRLYRVLSKKLYESDLDNIFHKIEMKLIPVLAELELNGVYMNVESLKNLSEEYEKRLERIREELFELAGEPFNPNSPTQVSKILFEKLGLNPPKKTKHGAYSTSAAVLEELVNEHPIIQKLLDYRKYQKLKSTYLDTLPTLVNLVTGRIHASYHQTGTGTGRLSSSNPNMQNLPIKGEEGKEIRKCVVPQKSGWKIISADYSQIELRVLAHFSEDERLISAFKNGEDVHALTASRLYGVSVKDVTPEMRQVGKMVNFSIIYGISPYGLARRLKIKTHIAENMISNYFNAYPGVRKFINEVIHEAKEKGYVRTLFGRKREIPHFRTRNKMKIQEGERIAINTPIQGTAADIMKLAMIKIHKMVKEEGLEAFPILQVHDELVFEAPATEVDRVCDILTRGMSGVVELKVPLEVEVAVNSYWGK
ncbi:DNA polymerase I [Kosmotoga sp. DU53]|uniref:DNA polymerase I n=1 Tax=Kosmotoga sp. DU53 TaxID=1310160 RepID=UPI0007C49608|nr:DNA polymerase I [Kosmotoga sp. DU53]OAA24476.1 DNA polymerase [Kosmotoga sp. DU53]